MDVELLFMLLQNVFDEDIDDAKGYVTKRVLLASIDNVCNERVFNKNDKKIVLEAVLEFVEIIGGYDRLVDLLFYDE